MWTQIRLLLRSSLIWVHTVCLYAKKGLKSLQEYSADDINRTFSDAGFLGVLRVNSVDFRVFCCTEPVAPYHNTRMTKNCWLRNRSALTVICWSALAVICWVINHWLEVSCKVIKSQAQNAEFYLLTTDWQNVIYYQQSRQKSWSILILSYRKRQKSNCILQIFLTFCYHTKKSCQQFWL